MDFEKKLVCFCSLLYLIHGVNGEQLKTLEALWNLTGYAIQSRQRFPIYPSQPINPSDYPNTYHHINRLQGTRYGENYPIYAGHYNNFEKYQTHHTPNINNPPNQNLHPTFGNYHPVNNIQNQHNYGLLRPQFGYPNPQFNYPQQNKGPLSSLLPSRESFMEALESITRNDELHCVPRILCEVTSGTLSARQSGLKLPFNVNMDSIVGLLSGFNGMELNPILSFGKAALLGYSSKGNAGTCMYAYPECPRDPERLVEYLNNYNGGFFRFFSGLSPQFQHNPPYGQPPEQAFQRPPSSPNFHPGNNNYRPYDPYRVYNYKSNKAEKRILTRPLEFDYGSNRFPDVRQQKGIKFPNDIDQFNNELYPANNFHNAESLRTLKFPIRDEDGRERPLRQPKRLPEIYGGFETNYQRPSPDHRPTPMIFPDRTGTGELKFTPEELAENFGRPSAFQNNNLISFDAETNNDPFYFSNGFEADNSGINRLNNRFFPA